MTHPLFVILWPFFPKPRCARQVTQTRRRMPSSSSTSAEAATTGLSKLRRLTVRLLRSKHRLAARETLCIPAKLTVDKLLDTRCARTGLGVHMVPSIWSLPMATTMTGLVACIAKALVAMETAVHGRRCRPFVHIALLLSCASVLCHRSRVRSKLSIFETHRHCNALDELILTHCTVFRASLSFTRKCGPKSAGFLPE